MNLMERKMDAVMRFIVAGDGAGQERARKEIRELMNCTAPLRPRTRNRLIVLDLSLASIMLVALGVLVGVLV
ncbi:MAG: hypothetical protein IJB11_06625 [Oscillospiraceae bacterium]|nr:hypothetical protein [Oscillospiraceae bacterium]